MEELLNKLIEKGWKPFGNCNRFDFRDLWLYYFANDNGRWSKYPLRMLVSKESWLWQFVCENGMIETKGNIRVKNYWGDDECDDNCCDDDLEYWLMESALTDEDKLEDFILSNIKVD